MKNPLLMLFIFSPILAFSQAYTPFISADSSDQWKSSMHCWDGSCWWLDETVQYIEGDTMINGQSYAQLWSRNFHDEGLVIDPYCPDDSYTWVDYAGALREDGKQVYFNDGSVNERLIYDFNVEVGDTVVDPLIGYQNTWQPVTVIVIDSTLINGAYRKRFILDSQYQFEGHALIEGIGSTVGLLNGYENISCTPDLICYAEQGQVLFGDSSCVLNVSMQEIGLEPNINVFPNPFYGELFIISDDPGAKSVQFFDMVGRMVEEFSMNSGEERIELPDMAEGIYMLRVRPLDGKHPASVFRIVRSGE